jgi:hypothetical protein
MNGRKGGQAQWQTIRQALTFVEVYTQTPYLGNLAASDECGFSFLSPQ